MSLRQVGVINDYTVIEAAGKTMASLLMTEMEDPVSITISSPGEDYGIPVNEEGVEVGANRVNLFLYHVKEAPHSINMDWVDAGEGMQSRYPLALQLFYMLNIFTTDKSSNLDEHRILGDVMRVFHANPIIDSIYFEGTLNPGEPPVGAPWEQFNIIHHPLPLDDLAAIWHAIDKPYRLSVAYEVSAVMIQPPAHKSRRVRRVDVTHVRAAPFRGKPILSHISPRRGYAGDEVELHGEGFSDEFLEVFLNEERITPRSVASTRVTIDIPDNTPPGLYWIRAAGKEGVSGKARFEEISPFLYRLDPVLKYTEDDDFPKNEVGEPMVTIRGGNFQTDADAPVTLLAAPGGSAAASFPIDSNQLKSNAIHWPIPASLRSGGAGLRVKQNGRVSNPLGLDIPSPRIYRVTPDPVTIPPGELIIAGDHFRDGNTSLHLYSATTDDPPAPASGPYDFSPLPGHGETEMRAALPENLDAGAYLLEARVYGLYVSERCTVKVNTS